MMVLFLSTNKDVTLEAPTARQVEESLDELLRFSDDPKLENDGFLVLALEEKGLLKTQKPPLLQVLASAYGWFVEHIDRADVATRTVRNSVSEQELKAAFFDFLDTAQRPAKLSWRSDRPLN